MESVLEACPLRNSARTSFIARPIQKRTFWTRDLLVNPCLSGFIRLQERIMTFLLDVIPLWLLRMGNFVFFIHCLFKWNFEMLQHNERRTSLYAIDAFQEKTAYNEFAYNEYNSEPNIEDSIQLFHQKANSIYIIEAKKLICKFSLSLKQNRYLFVV